MIRTSVEAAPPLTHTAELEHIVRAKAGDQAAMARLIQSWLPLAARVVMRYAQSEQAREEALAAAYVGIIEGVHAVDITRATRPWTFIRWGVMNEVLKCMHVSISAITVPNSIGSAASPACRQARDDAMLPHTLLSTPLAGDDGVTVGDVLAERPDDSAAMPDTPLPAAVSTAVANLAPGQRDSVEHYFGINGLPASPDRFRPGKQPGTLRVARRHGLDNLRKVLA